MSADVTCAFGGQCRPPAEVPPVAAFLRDSGWPMSAGSLRDTAKWLQSLDVDSAQDFVGLGDVDALPGAVLLTAETRRFLQTLVKASSCSMHLCMSPAYRMNHYVEKALAWNSLLLKCELTRISFRFACFRLLGLCSLIICQRCLQ